MCGITGFVYANSRKANREILEKMNQCIVHRGPDEDGFYLKENVALAMRRLSIIDLAGGQQPIFNEDRSKVIVYNGEVYNFQSLRNDLEKEGHKFQTNSDTEVILHLYDKHGADCLQFLRGMFAFAIWDETEKSLFLARDRVGKKPLLYSHQPNGDLIFGSEFRALLEHPAISREVDYNAIDSYMSYLCVPAPQTAFKQIRKLEPGHWLRWKNGRIETKRYWLPDFSKKIKITEQEAEEEALRILRESVKLRMISEVPLGAFLSGGVDSSTVVALMAQESEKPVKTFSIGFEEQDFSELKYAKRVAEHVGAEYHEFIVKPDALEVLPILVEHYGEPYADSSAIPTYYVSKETRKYVTVALNGDGGDESFAGYERYMAMRLAETYYRFPKLARQFFIEAPINLFPTSELKRNRIRDVKRFVQAASLPKVERYFRWVSSFNQEAKAELYTREFTEKTSANEPSRFLRQWFAKANGSGILDTALLTDQMTYLPNDLLVKVDIASMANSLEARSPFLDHNLIEFAASLPEKIKARRFETKSFLKRIAARLVPREVIYRRKMGFGVPVGSWFRGEMKEFVREILLSEKSLRRGIAKPEMIEKYVREHTEAERDHAFQIWTLLMLELWFQRFID
ncbi:MAG TPA: asparagine synthase (glutamine-hydrolyzing) [Pyrinomonadaceae bacterium]|nr:asparagine synthase (glutamine-hydrolyzing) [Pyrinomonadaceae bacterium]